MAYTEIQKRNKRKYYYRVISLRKRNKIFKKRKYLGVNLSARELTEKEKEADKKFVTKKEIKKKIIEELKPKIIKVLRKNKIKKAGIFGSYVRGEQKKDSDIDILIEPTKRMGLGFIGVKLELEDKLGKKIDLISYKGIHPLIKQKVLDEEIRII